MRTIESPGVEINEIDLSLYQQTPVGTNIAIFGFANQGPTEEPIYISTTTEYEQVFGRPTNAAERYMYHTANQILASPANLLVTRMPYGSGNGVGYGNQYTALVYPLVADTAAASATVIVGYEAQQFIPASAFNLNGLASTHLSSYAVADSSSSDNLSAIHPFASDIVVGEIISPALWAALNGELAANGAAGDLYGSLTTFDATLATALSAGAQPLVSVGYFAPVSSLDTSGYYYGAPTKISLTEAQYETLKCGGFNWKAPNNLTLDPSEFAPFNVDTIGGAGMIIVNKTRTTVDDIYEGYYVAVTDNVNAHPAEAFDDVTGVMISTSAATYGDLWTRVPTTRLAFALSAAYNGDPGSTSEVIENIPSVNFSDTNYNDSVIVSVWKLRPSNNSGTYTSLQSTLVEAHVGSLNSFRKEDDPFSGVKRTFFIENVINNNSRHLEAFVNPLVAEAPGWVGSDGLPAKAVRGIRAASNPGFYYPTVAITNFADSDKLFSLGEYVERLDATATNQRPKDIGNLPAKLERAILQVSNPELIDIDIVAEGGLATVWTTVKSDRNSWYTGDSRDQSYKFDDTVVLNVAEALAYDAVNSDGNFVPAGGLQDHFETIYNIFNTHAEFTMKRNGGVGHLFISDPLRQVLVNGRDCKVLGKNATDKSFSRNVYWPLRNLYQGANSSYSCTYGNWVKVADTTSDKYCWVPFSGWAAAVMGRTDQVAWPWIAPAGFNRGTVPGIVDIAINPNQKERDQLYRIGVNPVVLFPEQGYTVWGQKTLLGRPSAFDRINVRRLFLALEKQTQRTLRNFVFEPNTIFTRTRVINTITPLFELARNNEGIYDYLIICDERNNPPDVIDRNELCVDIYIKPVKAAEFICVNFVATRTGQDFNEII